MKIALDCLGCKLNQAETEHLARQLADAGYTLVGPSDAPDVYILNTCTVTHIADRKSRHLLRMARRRDPGVKLVAIGCYAQRAAQDLQGIEGVGLVLGNESKPRLLDRLEESGLLVRPALRDAVIPSHPGGRARAFIKVQDGCASFCAYCIVPLVRSREESVPLDRVVEEIRRAVADGHREAVLTGTKIGSYNYDGLDLAGLLERILSETAVARLRLSSLQSPEITPRLIGLWRDERLSPHFHLSLQSGSESVLGRMKRRYSLGEYSRAVARVRQAVPGLAVTTDVITGFPGETEAEFQESHDFCRRIEFSRIHVFPYSPRLGTEAARMPGRVSEPVKKERTRRMLALAEESARRFMERLRGKTMPVLWEKQANGVWSGLTGNYVRVYARSGLDLANKLLPARLIGLERDGLRAEPPSDSRSSL